MEVRVIEIDVRRYARTYGREAVDKLIELMRGKLTLQAKATSRPRCCRLARQPNWRRLKPCLTVAMEDRHKLWRSPGRTAGLW